MFTWLRCAKKNAHACGFLVPMFPTCPSPLPRLVQLLCFLQRYLTLPTTLPPSGDAAGRECVRVMQLRVVPGVGEVPLLRTPQPRSQTTEAVLRTIHWPGFCWQAMSAAAQTQLTRSSSRHLLAATISELRYTDCLTCTEGFAVRRPCLPTALLLVIESQPCPAARHGRPGQAAVLYTQCPAMRLCYARQSWCRIGRSLLGRPSLFCPTCLSWPLPTT